MSQAIGIDLGGTNIKAALVETASARTLATLSKPTRDGEFDGDTPRFALTVREIVQEFEAQAGQKLRVGLSAPAWQIQMAIASTGCPDACTVLKNSTGQPSLSATAAC